MTSLLLAAQLGGFPVWAWLSTIVTTGSAVAVAYFGLLKVRARAAAEVEMAWI